MTTALLVGDVHLTDTSHKPSSRTSTYKDDILDKLHFCVEEANQLSVPLVQAGDMFHLKASSKNSHRLVQEVHEILKEVRQGAWIVPGNHDLMHDRLDSLDKQPLGSLCRMDNVNLLIGIDEQLPGIAGIPYLTEFDGGDWKAVLHSLANFGMTEPELIVTHAPIFPPGQEPGVYASILPSDWTNWFGAGATYYGHIHDCHGTFEVDGHVFCNQGALSRGSLHEETVNRKPAITLWDGTSFTRIEVPHKAPEEVFLFSEADKKTANRTSAQAFADALGKTKLHTLTLEDVRANLRSQVSNSEVMKIIDTCLESVQ